MSARSAWTALSVMTLLSIARPALAHPRETKRHKPDLAAMREVTSMRSKATERYVSAGAISHYLAAALARAKGDHYTALAQLREVALYDSESPEAQCELAQEYLLQDMPKPALVAVKQGLASDPRNARALTMLGRIHLRLGESDQAADALRRATANYLNDGLARRAVEPAALLVEALVANGQPAATVSGANEVASLAGPGASPSVRGLVADAIDHAAQALANSEDRERKDRVGAAVKP